MIKKKSQFDKEGKDLICPACGRGAMLTDSKKIYNKAGFGLIWVCQGYPWCNSYVGCHKGTTTPKGELADAETRSLRIKIHSVIDPIWKEKGHSRTELYKELSIKTGRFPFHVGDLNADECRELMPVLQEWVKKFY